MSLLNCVPYVLPCQRALRAYVPTFLACLRAHVPTRLVCLLAHVPCVLTCSRANVSCMSTWLHDQVLMPRVPTCQRALRALRAYALTCYNH